MRIDRLPSPSREEVVLEVLHVRQPRFLVDPADVFRTWLYPPSVDVKLEVTGFRE